MSEFLNRNRLKASEFAENGKVELQALVKEDMLKANKWGDPITSIRIVTGSVRNQGQRSLGRLGSLARNAFGRLPVRHLETQSTDPAERFVAAQQAYGKDDSAVLEVQDNNYRIFMIYVAVAVGFIGIDIATWQSYHSSPVMLVGHISPIIPALVMAFVVAFRNWQARTRRLDSFLSFVRKPEFWWPEPSYLAPTTGAGRGTAAMILMVSAGLSAIIIGTAPPAYAATATGASALPSLFAVLPGTDLWGQLLTYVFPGVGPVAAGDTPISQGIANAFASMIACLEALAAAMMSYQTVIACAATAHEGELLGKRWNTMWAPVRICYGFASLAPVVKGYCLLQILCLWVAVASGQMGNIMWSSFVGGLTSPTITTPSLPETMNYVREQMGTEVCFAEAVQLAGTSVPPPVWPSTPVASQGIGTYFTGIMSTIASTITGNAMATGPATLAKNVWDYGPCGTVSGNFTSGGTPLATLSTGQIAAINNLRLALQPIAAALVQTTQSGPSATNAANSAPQFAAVITAKTNFDAELIAANQQFVTAMSNGSGTGTNGLSAFQTAATSAGWMSAGSYYMTLARINTAIIDAAQNLPSVDTTNYNANSSSSGVLTTAVNGEEQQVVNSNLSEVDSPRASFNAWWQAGMATANLSTTAAAAGTMTADSVWSGLKWAGSTDTSLQQGVMNMVKLSPTNMNGMQQMIDLGNYIVGIGETLVGGIAILKMGFASTALGKITAGIGAAGTALGSSATSSMMAGPISFAAMFLGMVGVAIMGAGVFDAVVLPMIPYMHFTFASMGILIIVVEGVVAAPLWAFSHIRLDGSEFLDGPQRAGYKILFNLMFRIPLTIMGLFLSFEVFNAMVWLLSITLYPAMASATANSLFGILGEMVMLVLITAINWQVATRSFSLITALPDRVTRWFEGSDGGSNEHNESLAAIGVIKGGAQTAISGMAKNAMGGKAAGKGKGIGAVTEQAAATDTATFESAPSAETRVASGSSTQGEV